MVSVEKNDFKCKGWKIEYQSNILNVFFEIMYLIIYSKTLKALSY